MALRAPDQSSTPSLAWFFIMLGLLLLVSTMLPSCHSRHKQWVPISQELEGHKPNYSPTPPPSRTMVPPTPSTPHTPAPPHR